jgi:preprotein translocase subunit SecD
MNRYPLWKYLVIAIVLAIGFLYASPNIFGEVPAVQISPLQPGVKVDTELMSKVEAALAQDGVTSTGGLLDPTGLKMKFADTDTQLKAKDIIQKALGEDYVVALNLLSNAPEWMRSLNILPMYLGLDLRGGVHFLLQVDMNGALSKAAERYVGDVRQLMREKEIRYAGVTRDGSAVQVRYRDDATREKGKAAIEANIPGVTVKTRDEGATSSSC